MGKKVTFRPVNFFNNPDVLPVVTGEQVRFGLVLHRDVWGGSDWYVSEPFSGGLVAQGDDRAACLKNLRLQELIVQYDHGIPFADWLQTRRDEVLRERGMFLVEHDGALVAVTIPGSGVCRNG